MPVKLFELIKIN